MAQIRSRILQYMPKELLVSLNDICYDVTIPDNNTKVDLMVSILDKYDIDYIELGPGTNRFAILIDGYVFKIAMDRYGVKDNWAEFAIAKELQPYVTKTYECNGLVVVAEYVTVISKDEFIEKKDNIRTILSYLAQGYLMGDVGSISKNFMNWGYRDDGQLVILDFAYIYRIKGDEMICGGLNSDGEQCMEFLEYDENFNKLTCPKCRKTYTFYDIRKKIDSEYEKNEVELSKQMAYQTTEANTPIGEKAVIKTEPITKSDIYGKDDEEMYNEYANEYDNKITNEDFEEMYEAAMNKLPSVSPCDVSTEDEPVTVAHEELKVNMEDVLETAAEFVEVLDIEQNCVPKTSTPSDYEMMRKSISFIGENYDSDEEDSEYYSDPEELGYVSECDADKPSTISETVANAVSEELEEEFNAIKDDPECIVTTPYDDEELSDGDEELVENARLFNEIGFSDCDEVETSSSITFVDEEPIDEDIENVIEDADCEEKTDEYPEEYSEQEDYDGEVVSEDDECVDSENVYGYLEEDIIENNYINDRQNDGTLYDGSDDCATKRYTIEAESNEYISEEDSIERDITESEQKSFIQFIEPDDNCDNDIEAMRRSLRSDIPTDDELDAMYDEAVMENQKYRYNKRGRDE